MARQPCKRNVTPTYLYYAEISSNDDVYWKVGISKNPVERLTGVTHHGEKFKILYTERFCDRDQAAEAEALVKRVFRAHCDRHRSNATESFMRNVFEGIKARDELSRYQALEEWADTSIITDPEDWEASIRES